MTGGAPCSISASYEFVHAACNGNRHEPLILRVFQQRFIGAIRKEAAFNEHGRADGFAHDHEILLGGVAFALIGHLSDSMHDY